MRTIRTLPLFLLPLLLADAASAQLISTNYCTPAVTNSTGQPAAISAIGTSQVGGNPLSLIGSQLPPNQFGYLLTSLTQGNVPTVGGSQGTLCLGGTIGRYTSQITNSGAMGTISVAVNTLAMPVNPAVAVQAGQGWNFQFWYRDFNPTPTSNFTDAMTVTFWSQGPPIANFTANPTQGTYPLFVQFTDSSALATGWLWDFGDGTTSTLQNPTHTYTARGDYTVQLVVTGPGGMDTEVKPNFIDVDQGFSEVWTYLEQLNIDPFTMQQTADACIDCHGASFGWGGLMFPNQAGAYANLVNVPAQCGNGSAGLRVSPGDLAGSLFYTKLTPSPACGSQMPFGSTFAGDLQVVANWILDGAQQ